MKASNPKLAARSLHANQPKRLLLVDDHPVFRAGLASLLATDAALQVCAEAGDELEAMRLMEAALPDLVLMDISLPGRGGLELLRDARSRWPALKVLVISMHDETVYAERVLRAGGRGYIMKQAGPERILAAIHRVLAGSMAFSETMSSRLLEVMSGKAQSPLAALSEREFEVFQLVGKGMEADEIAAALSVSIKTVDTHRASIRRKLGLRGNAELIRHAVQWTGGQVQSGDVQGSAIS